MKDDKYLLNEAEIEAEAEKLCRWGAARAGLIAAAPLLGTVALIANEVYMIGRLGKLRGVELEEGAVKGLLAGLGATFCGQTLATLLPLGPLNIPLGVSITYAVGKVANAWIKAGQPEDIAAFKELYEEAYEEGRAKAADFARMDCKKEPLGDEKRTFGGEEGLEQAFARLCEGADALETKLKEKVNAALHKK